MLTVDYLLSNQDSEGGSLSETKYLETHEWYIVNGESFTVGDGWMVKAEIKEMDDSGMTYQQYESFIS